MRYTVQKSQLQGSLVIPPSKSHTLRAILFASLAHGKSVVQGFLLSPDAEAMVKACQMMGAEIEIEGDCLHITGNKGKIKTPHDVIDCGNSGIVLRFVGAVASLCENYTVLTGDHSIRSNRPASPLISGINQLGGFAVSTKGDGHAPLVIRGPLKPGSATIEGDDSQPVSGLLIATALLEGASELIVKSVGEKPWVEMTLQWLSSLGMTVVHENYERYWIKGYGRIEGFQRSIPGDFSSAAYPLVAAIITGSEVELQNLDLDDCQGDKQIIDLLQQMGAHIVVDKEKKSVYVLKGSQLRGMTIDVNPFVDALPILAVVGCVAEGETRLVNGAIARKKESDRIKSMCINLSQMGARIVEIPDGLVIKPSQLTGAVVESFRDQRIAMSTAIAALVADSKTVIEGVECVAKSYPQFAAKMRKLGAKLCCQ